MKARVDNMEEMVGLVQEEVELLQEEIKKILAIEQGITNLMNTMEQLLRAQGNHARESNSKNQIDSTPTDNLAELGSTSGGALEVTGVPNPVHHGGTCDHEGSNSLRSMVTIQMVGC
ncbi:hypothetical protein AB3S75_000004 [Citrus x aurantiifolia]